MLRTLEKDITFKNDKNKVFNFKKGEQFLILTNHPTFKRYKDNFKNPNKYNPNRFNNKVENSNYYIIDKIFIWCNIFT